MLRSSFRKETMKKIPSKETRAYKEERAPKYVAAQEVKEKKPQERGDSNAIKIPCCKNPGHRLWECDTFKGKNTEEHLEYVRQTLTLLQLSWQQASL